MEWMADDPGRGETVLALSAFGIAVILVVGGIVWLGRRRLVLIITVASVWLLLAAIAIPGFIPARNVAFRNACINNLREIEKAKVSWVKAEHKFPADISTFEELCVTNKFLRYKPTCPAGGIYTLGALEERVNCSLTDKGHKLE